MIADTRRGVPVSSVSSYRHPWLMAITNDIRLRFVAWQCTTTWTMQWRMKWKTWSAGFERWEERGGAGDAGGLPAINRPAALSWCVGVGVSPSIQVDADNQSALFAYKHHRKNSVR